MQSYPEKYEYTKTEGTWLELWQDVDHVADSILAASYTYPSSYTLLKNLMIKTINLIFNT
jgi:hypothetical protein